MKTVYTVCSPGRNAVVEFYARPPRRKRTCRVGDPAVHYVIYPSVRADFTVRVFRAGRETPLAQEDLSPCAAYFFVSAGLPLPSLRIRNGRTVTVLRRRDIHTPIRFAPGE